ncbi:MAG: HEAT repeat domain-containing protein, partial [Planctomycetia bacterium]|nr:HEAT repeat domain-containing protein [Planctomycetia bacterium]
SPPPQRGEGSSRAKSEILAELKSWLKNLDSSDPEVGHHKLEALWVYQTLDEVEPDLLAELLQNPDGRIRAAATRVLALWHDRLPRHMESLERLVIDEHPRVRIESVTALARLSTPKAAVVAMRALDRPVDRFLDHALWQTARDLEPQWMPVVRSGDLDFDGRVRHLTFALEAVGSPQVVEPLAKMFKEGKIPPERQDGVLSLIAALGGPQELSLVYKLALDEKTAAPTRARLLEALGQAARQRKVRPAGDLSAVASVLTDKDESLRIAAARTGGAWQVESLRQPLVEIATSADVAPPLRRAALEGLAGLGGSTAIDTCRKLCEKSRPLAVRLLAAEVLGQIDAAAAAPLAVDVLSAADGSADVAQLYLSFLGRKNGPVALAGSLKDKKLPADVAKIGLRVAQSTGQPQPELVAALTSAGGITAGPRILPPAEIAVLVAEVQKSGDPERGEAIYRRKDLGCLKCHAISGAGGRVGPDLVSIGASAQVDYLVESILDPNKAVKENYHSVVVLTGGGQVVTGVKVRQSEKDLLLRDAEDREIAVPLSDIEQQSPGQSLMPANLADALTRAELVDLVRFLSELGKIGPYAVNKARLVRQWEALQPTPESIHVLNRTSFRTAATGDPALQWGNAYTKVSGDLPLSDLPVLKVGHQLGDTAFVRFALDVSTAGKVRLRFDSASALTLWVDGDPREAAAKIDLDLSRGPHVVTLAISLADRREPLRCELDDVPGSSAQAQVAPAK